MLAISIHIVIQQMLVKHQLYTRHGSLDHYRAVSNVDLYPNVVAVLPDRDFTERYWIVELVSISSKKEPR